MLPKSAIDEFKKIYKKTSGKDLKDKEAPIIAQRVFDGFKVLMSITDIYRDVDLQKK